MIKAQLEKGKSVVVEAKGSVPELLADIGVLVGAIYNQFLAADLNTATAFRCGVVGMIADPESRVWKPIDGQTGIIFPTAEKGDIDS